MQALAIRGEPRKLILPTATAADNPFRRYGETKRQEVRHPDVTGQTFAERVKRTREMLRSMKPEAVSQIIEFRRDLSFFQALALAKKEGRLIVPNDVHDRILTKLTGRKDKKYLKENYPVWTGTLVIYEKPDIPFGEQVVFSWERNKVKYSLSFEVPEQFQGKVNCALVVEHPDFELIALENNKFEFKVLDSKIQLIKGFPKENGWHMPHAETGIPQGNEVKRSSDSRYIWRNGSSYLGPVARGVGIGGNNRRQDVYAFCRSTDRFGVAFIGLGEAMPKEG